MAIREYRSNMFSMLLKEPRYALEVYNALNNSNYQNEEDVEIFCLENGISLSVRNDASFLLDNQLNIYEQQSTVNHNMPLRSLIYFSDLVKEYIEKVKGDLFDKKIVYIPNPRFVVFYNGIVDCPELQELRLSEAFIIPEKEPQLELRCMVYNINPNNNEDLKARSTMLNNYVEFIEKVKAKGPFGNDKGKLREALEAVIAEFIQADKLKEFLMKHGDEVVEMETLDFTYERRVELVKKAYYDDGFNDGQNLGLEQGLERGLEQGLEQGLERGLEQGIKALILDNIDEGRATEIIIDKLKKRFNLTEQKAKECVDKYSKELV